MYVFATNSRMTILDRVFVIDSQPACEHIPGSIGGQEEPYTRIIDKN